MSDILFGFLVFCLGFGGGALFTTWQTRVEEQIDLDDEADIAWRQAQERQALARAQATHLSNLPPEWARPGVN